MTSAHIHSQRPGRGYRPTSARFPQSQRRRFARLYAARQRGSVTIELVLVTPIFVLLLLFIVALGRAADADIQVQDAAHAAARAATLAAYPAAAQAAAEQAATASLTQAGVSCQSFAVDAAVGDLAPGSTVRVTVTCTVGLADVSGINLPGARTVSATYASIVDRYRSNPQAAG
jgi:Flp pilus assembly protein TadG